jgi:hypothetical protein
VTYEQLQQTAMSFLAQTFRTPGIATPAHVVQAAVTIAITPKPARSK